MIVLYASKRKSLEGVLIMKCPREVRHTIKNEAWIHPAYSNGVKRILWRPYLRVCFALGSSCKRFKDWATTFLRSLCVLWKQTDGSCGGCVCRSVRPMLIPSKSWIKVFSLIWTFTESSGTKWYCAIFTHNTAQSPWDYKWTDSGVSLAIKQTSAKFDVRALYADLFGQFHPLWEFPTQIFLFGQLHLMWELSTQRYINSFILCKKLNWLYRVFHILSHGCCSCPLQNMCYININLPIMEHSLCPLKFGTVTDLKLAV
jgi:hypothetical protein